MSPGATSSALGRLVRLEKLIFVFNDWSPVASDSDWGYMHCWLRILGRLAPLHDIPFANPDEETRMIKW